MSSLLSELKRNITLLPQWFQGVFEQMAGLRQLHQRNFLLQGRMASWEVRNKDEIETLADVEFQVFSQWGEDGIIDWLIHHLGDIPTRFVEFGVESYAESNTRFLLQNRNWKGLILDSNRQLLTQLKSDPIYWRHDLSADCAFIHRDNINGLLAKHGYGSDLGLLSIDIDGNDYWVLEQLEPLDAAILVVEYNPILGDVYPISIPYQETFDRFEVHHSGLYFGASIRALIDLAKRREYTFVGSNSNGINAFFVRDDLYPRLSSRIGKCFAWPSRHRDCRDESGELCFVSGLARLEQIKSLPVIRTDSGESIQIESLANPYSPEWLALM